MTIVMDKKVTISSLALCLSILPIALGLRAAKPRQIILLRDGFALTGIDGKLVIHDSNKDNPKLSLDRWFFELDSDLSDGRYLVKAGASLELLPSSVLERLIADANNNPGTSYRLGGRVTRYRDKNFIFPTYFLPLAKTKQPKSSTSQKSPQQEGPPKINEPNDVLTIPKELIDTLPERKKRIDHSKPEETGKEIRTIPGGKTTSGLKRDSILADRCGFIRESSRQAQDAWRKVSFVLDAIGRTEGKMSLHVLPCQALEQAQRRQSAALDTLRFKIAGIVTRFKGKRYLLLQRATRLYSHGNFPE